MADAILLLQAAMASKFLDSKVHGTNLWPTWDRHDLGGPYVGPMNLAIWEAMTKWPITVPEHQNDWCSSLDKFLQFEFESMQSVLWCLLRSLHWTLQLPNFIVFCNIGICRVILFDWLTWILQAVFVKSYLSRLIKLYPDLFKSFCTVHTTGKVRASKRVLNVTPSMVQVLKERLYQHRFTVSATLYFRLIPLPGRNTLIIVLSGD